MAKKKSAGPAQKRPVSPVKYMKERVGSLPIYKCFWTENWQEAGIADVFVTRRRPSGELVIGVFLVDTYCLGVKSVLWNISFDDEELMEYVRNMNLVEVSYPEAHNLIYGAIAYAEELGIEPHPDFEIGENILEEDSDDIELIEYEYGHDGKPLLVVGEDGKERKYIGLLTKRLGPDGFNFVMPADYQDPEFIDDDDDNGVYDDDDDEDEESDEFHEHVSEALDIFTLSVVNNYTMSGLAAQYSFEMQAPGDEPEIKLSYLRDYIFDDDDSLDMFEGVATRLRDEPSAIVSADLSNIITYLVRRYSAIPDSDVESGTDEAEKTLQALQRVCVMVPIGEYGAIQMVDDGAESAEAEFYTPALMEALRLVYSMNDVHTSNFICGHNTMNLIIMMDGSPLLRMLSEIVRDMSVGVLGRINAVYRIYMFTQNDNLSSEKRNELTVGLNDIMEWMVARFDAGEPVDQITATVLYRLTSKFVDHSFLSAREVLAARHMIIPVSSDE